MTVFRYSVPVDGAWHAIVGAGRIVHVDCRRSDTVEFWAISGAEHTAREFKVFATGQRAPEGLTYIGTALTPGVAPLASYGGFVWHLFEREAVVNA